MYMKSIISDYLGLDDIIILATKLVAILAIPMVGLSSVLEEHGFNIWHGIYGASGQALTTAVAVYYILKAGKRRKRVVHPFVSILLFVMEVFFGFIVALLTTHWLGEKVSAVVSTLIGMEVVIPEMVVAVILGALAPWLLGKVRDFFSKKEGQIPGVFSSENGGGEDRPADPRV